MATKKAATTKKVSVKKTTKLSVSKRIETSIKSVTFWRALGAEFIGTFLLAAAIITSQGQGVPILALFALAGIVLIVGAISGAHVNPAITIAALVTRRIDAVKAVGYIVAQVVGALLAAVTLNAFLAGAAPVSEQAALYGQAALTLYQAVDLTTLAGKEWFVFFAELLGTAILAFAIASALRQTADRVASAFTAGLGIFIALLVAVSAASYVGATTIINPAVAASLQAIDWSAWSLAVYVLAPVIGGVVGFVVHDLVRGR